MSSAIATQTHTDPSAQGASGWIKDAQSGLQRQIDKLTITQGGKLSPQLETLESLSADLTVALPVFQEDWLGYLDDGLLLDKGANAGLSLKHLALVHNVMAIGAQSVARFSGVHDISNETDQFSQRNARPLMVSESQASALRDYLLKNGILDDDSMEVELIKVHKLLLPYDTFLWSKERDSYYTSTLAGNTTAELQNGHSKIKALETALSYESITEVEREQTENPIFQSLGDVFEETLRKRDIARSAWNTNQDDPDKRNSILEDWKASVKQLHDLAATYSWLKESEIQLRSGSLQSHISRSDDPLPGQAYGRILSVMTDPKYTAENLPVSSEVRSSVMELASRATEIMLTLQQNDVAPLDEFSRVISDFKYEPKEAEGENSD